MFGFDIIHECKKCSRTRYPDRCGLKVWNLWQLYQTFPPVFKTTKLWDNKTSDTQSGRAIADGPGPYQAGRLPPGRADARRQSVCQASAWQTSGSSRKRDSFFPSSVSIRVYLGVTPRSSGMSRSLAEQTGQLVRKIWAEVPEVRS